MHLGTLLTISTVVLLATEILLAITLARLARVVDGHPGGHFLRILTRTVTLVVAAQGLEVITDVGLDLAPETSLHLGIITLELVSLLLVFSAIAWAWWDLTRSDYQR